MASGGTDKKVGNEWDAVRALALRLADSQAPDPADRQALFDGLWPALEAAADRLLPGGPRGGRGPRKERIHASGFDSAALLDEFLKRKLCSQRFLHRLAGARNVRALLRTTLRHLLIDLRRRAPPVLAGGSTPDDIRSPQGDPTTGGGAVLSPEALLIGHEQEQQRRRAVDRVLDRLPVARRVLLKVVYGWRQELDDEEVVWLAARRRLPVDAVRAELATRVEHYDERRGELEARLERTERDIARLFDRIRRVAAVADELGDRHAAPVDAPVEQTEAELLRLHRSATVLRRAGPAARRALRIALERRLEAAQVARRAIQEEGRSSQAVDKRWDEVARLLGELPAGADEATRRRVANTVTVRFKRLVEELRARHGAGFGDA